MSVPSVYACNALTGGGSGSLDSIVGTGLIDGDVAIYFSTKGPVGYYLDADSGLAESSPTIIAPDTDAGDKRWIQYAAPFSYKGVIDCSASPNYPAANMGDIYIVSVAGIIGGASGITVQVNDLLICKTDSSASGTEAAVGANWSTTNIGQKISAAGAITEPLDADVFPLYKAVGTLIKKVTWANIKATLKTYFDTLYTTTFASAAEITAGAETDKVIAPDQLVLSSPTVVTIKCSSLGALKVPKHVADATGLADTTINVTADNEVTNPSQPAFLAYNSATDADQTGNGDGAVVDFDTEVFDQGGDFAADVFTAPVTGKYLLNVAVFFTGCEAGDIISVVLGTSNRNYSTAMGFTYTNHTSNFSVLADMDAGDTATVTVYVTGVTKNVSIYGGANGYTSFSGALIC